MVEEGNRLRERGEWLPEPTRRGRYSGGAYDPETNRTTGGAASPRGAIRSVEEGNTLYRYGAMPPRYTGRASGSLYDPQTNTTTTVIGGPGVYGRTVEMGNTLRRH
jgi:hypothetical protein